MNITIRERTVAYVPDYTPTSPAWKVQLRDAHRLAVIGGTDCFVKRFERRLPAWDFLVANRGVRHSGLPLIYDAQSISEGGQTVYYLFLEKIAGELLHDLIRKGGTASGPALGQAMAAAFQVVHSQGYWHADFCTKNIMVTADKKQFVLIDLDSLEPAATRPSTVPNQPGYLPDQELAVYALTYVKTYVQPTIREFAAFPGPALNLVQLLFLLDKLVYFAVRLKPKQAKFGQKKHFEKLPAVVHDHLAPYTDKLVKDILAGRPVAAEVLLSQGKNLQTQLQALPEPVAPPVPLVSIQYLRASKTSLKPGESVIISWATTGAASAVLTFYPTVAASGSLTLSYEQLADFSKKKEGQVELILSAGWPRQTKSVTVELKLAQTVNFPSIQPTALSTSPSPRTAPVLPLPTIPAHTVTPPKTSTHTFKPDYRPTAKVVKFTVNRKYLALNDIATISWEVENCDDVWISCNDMGKGHWVSPWNGGWGQGGKRFQGAKASMQVSLSDFGPAHKNRLWLVFELFKTDNTNTYYHNILYRGYKDFVTANVNLVVIPHKRFFLTFWFWVLVANLRIANRLKTYYDWPKREHPIPFWRGMKKFSNKLERIREYWFGDWIKISSDGTGFSRFGCFFIYFPFLLLLILMGLISILR